YRDGVPSALMEAKEIRFLVEMTPAEQWQARQALLRRFVPPKVRAYLNQTGRTVSPPQISTLTHSFVNQPDSGRSIRLPAPGRVQAALPAAHGPNDPPA